MHFFVFKTFFFAFSAPLLPRLCCLLAAAQRAMRLDAVGTGLHSKDGKVRGAALEALVSGCADDSLSGGSSEEWRQVARGLASCLGDANAKIAAGACDALVAVVETVRRSGWQQLAL